MLNKNLKTIVINKKIFSGNKATNFIYKIEANNFDNIFSVNEIEGKGKIIKRVQEITKNYGNLEFSMLND